SDQNDSDQLDSGDQQTEDELNNYEGSATVTQTGELVHVVNHGESIATIARTYGITPGKLIRLNRLQEGTVKVGQRITIRKAARDEQKFEPIRHMVLPDESMFSIAEKFGVTINNIKRWNNATSNNVIPGQQLIVNYIGSGSSEMMDENSDNSFLSDIDIDRVAIVEKGDIVPPGVDPGDYWRTVENLTAYYQSSDTNFIYQLLQYSHPHYSIVAMSNAQIYRVQNSDLVRISFTSDDPGICQQTLKIMTDVFIENYKELKANMTDQVVRYFEERVREAQIALTRAEDEYLKFNEDNNIINYYEQSKAIAIKKEDLDEQYQDMQIAINQAMAALSSIESRLAKKDSVYLKSDQITNKRNQLAEITKRITINEVSQDFDPNTTKRVKELERQRDRIRDDMKLFVDQLHLYSRTVEGVSLKDLLVSWLENTIKYEESKASLGVLQARKKKFELTYQTYAPLGATVKRIERRISVAEQEYLELLRSLNLAKMKQQNLEMSTNLKIVDPPFYPLTVASSKTRLLTLAAAMIGFIMVLFIILVLEYFDTTTKRPDLISKQTNLELAGAYPDQNVKDNSVDLKKASDRLIEVVAQNLKLHLNYTSVRRHEKPHFVLVFSTQAQSGKTTITNHLIEKLRSFGDKVLFMNYTYDDEKVGLGDGNDLINYKIDNKFFELKHVKDLLNPNFLRSENYEYDYIVMELPATLYNSYPLDLMGSFDASLLVTRATHDWKKADASSLELISKVLPEKPLVILNDVELYIVEELLHGVPKTGNNFATRMKKYAKATKRMRITFDKE
ncbi:MAG: LysM peptidoglycan-binding domain-containing protein, partial [Bacteroidales bacterium]|nr:LysM peptidoglycan-binding domain-containing protein [Bacteroidales bacterium]